MPASSHLRTARHIVGALVFTAIASVVPLSTAFAVDQVVSPQVGGSPARDVSGDGQGVVSAGLPAPDVVDSPSGVWWPAREVTGSGDGVVSVVGEGAADHVVTCSFTAYVPIRYPTQNKVTGTGKILACTPSDPQLCTMYVDIQIYDPTERLWHTVATTFGEEGPPCGGLVDVATYINCTTSAQRWKYRSLSVVTIVEDGVPDANHKYSGAAYYYCL